MIDNDICIQPAGFLLELSPDWIVRRASENVHNFVGQSHVNLIDEPLGRFVQAQPLHDLRNLFARLSSTTGVARAYRVRLCDDRDRFDIAFQLSDHGVVLEAVPSPDRGVGDTIGSVGGLIEGLSMSSGAALFEGAVRRMRALTGFDRVSLAFSVEEKGQAAESSRGQFGRVRGSLDPSELPTMISVPGARSIPVFPRRPEVKTLQCALLRAPSLEQVAALRREGVESVLTVPIKSQRETIGWLRCDNRTPRTPSVETHAAAELFVQGFAMQLEIDRLRSA